MTNFHREESDSFQDMQVPSDIFVGRAPRVFFAESPDRVSMQHAVARALQQEEIQPWQDRSGESSVRLALVHYSARDLRKKLRRALSVLKKGEQNHRELNRRGSFLGQVPSARSAGLVFCFAAPERQFVGMGRDLFEENKTFRETMLRLGKIAREAGGFDLLHHLYPEHRTRVQQKAISTLPGAALSVFAVQVSHAMALREMGVLPEAVVGQGFGEFSALVVAGVLSLEDGMRAVVACARLLTELQDREGLDMLRITCSQTQIDGFLSLCENRVVLSHARGQRSFVLAGSEDGVRLAASLASTMELEKHREPLQSALCARDLSGFRASVERALSEFTWNAPQLKLLSCVEGRFCRQDMERADWIKHVSRLFCVATDVLRDIRALRGAGFLDFLELGPGGRFRRAIREEIGDEECRVEISLHHKARDAEMTQRMRAFLMTCGYLEAPLVGMPEGWTPAFLEYLEQREPALASLLLEAHGRFESFEARNGVGLMSSRNCDLFSSVVAPHDSSSRWKHLDPPSSRANAPRRPITQYTPPNAREGTAKHFRPSSQPGTDHHSAAFWMNAIRTRVAARVGCAPEGIDIRMDLGRGFGLSVGERLEIWEGVLREHNLSPGIKPGSARNIADMVRVLQRVHSPPHTGPREPVRESPDTSPAQLVPYMVSLEHVQKAIESVSGHRGADCLVQARLIQDLQLSVKQRGELYTLLLKKHRLPRVPSDAEVSTVGDLVGFLRSF